MRYIFICVLVLLFACTMNGQSAFKGAYDKKEFQASDGSSLLYNIYIPDGLEAGVRLPLFIFLHGSGERGSDNQSQLKHVAHRFDQEDFQSKFPSIVIVPQCPSGGYWAPIDRSHGDWRPSVALGPMPSMERLIELLEVMRDYPQVDLNRIYLAGLSMGGFGTYDLLSRHANWFAGAVGICAGADLSRVENFKHVPLQIFHGTKDKVVPVDLSRTLFDKLRDLGSAVEYTEYPDGDHFVWDQAFEGEKVLKWLFSQDKSK